MNLTAAVEEYLQRKPWARSGLRAFLAYSRVEDTRWLRAEDLVGFCRSLQGRGLAPNSAQVYLCVANRFVRELVERKLACFGLTALEEAIAEQGRFTEPVLDRKLAAAGEEEVRELVEAAYEAVPGINPRTGKGWRAYLTYLRNIALVETLRASGVRPAELVALRLGDLNLRDQVARAPDGRLLYFDLRSWGAVMRYLLARGDAANLPLHHQKLPVFARHDAGSGGKLAGPLHVNSVNGIVRKLRRSEMVTASSLRVRFGRSLLAATTDERGAARLLGLKRVRNVRRYGER